METKPQLQMITGVHFDLDDEIYHRSPECNALSAGGIKSILKSPAHFKTSQGNTNNSPALVFGRAAHSYIFQPELEKVICEPPGMDRRRKDDKAFLKLWHEENKDKIIIGNDEFDTLKSMKYYLYRSETVKMMLKKGKPEVSGFWRHPVYDFLCKCRPDFLIEDLGWIVDYKTCKDASAEAFGRTVVNFQYDVQASWYTWGMELLTGREWTFVFIAQEKTPPYGVAIYSVGPDVLKRGKPQCKRASEIYNDCLKSDKWPGYPDTIQNVQLPGWARR